MQFADNPAKDFDGFSALFQFVLVQRGNISMLECSKSECANKEKGNEGKDEMSKEAVRKRPSRFGWVESGKRTR